MRDGGFGRLRGWRNFLNFDWFDFRGSWRAHLCRDGNWLRSFRRRGWRWRSLDFRARRGLLHFRKHPLHHGGALRCHGPGCSDLRSLDRAGQGCGATTIQRFDHITQADLVVVLHRLDHTQLKVQTLVRGPAHPRIHFGQAIDDSKQLLGRGHLALLTDLCGDVRLKVLGPGFGIGLTN